MDRPEFSVTNSPFPICSKLQISRITRDVSISATLREWKIIDGVRRKGSQSTCQTTKDDNKAKGVTKTPNTTLPATFYPKPCLQIELSYSLLPTVYSEFPGILLSDITANQTLSLLLTLCIESYSGLVTRQMAL